MIGRIAILGTGCLKKELGLSACKYSVIIIEKVVFEF
jgi:hypothetical protein